MKLMLSTATVCLSLLFAVLTLKETIRSEGKRTRAAASRALVEPLEASKEPESVAQKLDAVQAQLTSLNRRLAQLEEASGNSARTSPPETAADPLLDEVRTLSANVRGVSEALSKLGGVPDHLAQLTSFLDQSFEHVDKQLAAKAMPDELFVSIDWLVQRVDDIDHYFPSLFGFLGVVYDPANEDVLKAYPSVDARLNELAVAAIALQRAVADIRKNMMVPTVIEPGRYQR